MCRQKYDVKTKYQHSSPLRDTRQAEFHTRAGGISTLLTFSNNISITLSLVLIMSMSQWWWVIEVLEQDYEAHNDGGYDRHTLTSCCLATNT